MQPQSNAVLKFRSSAHHPDHAAALRELAVAAALLAAAMSSVPLPTLSALTEQSRRRPQCFGCEKAVAGDVRGHEAGGE